MIKLAEYGLGLTYFNVKTVIKNYLDSNGIIYCIPENLFENFHYFKKNFIGLENVFKDNTPGQRWYKLFMQRHKELSERVPANLSYSRAKGMNSKYISPFFDMLNKLYTQYNFPQENIFNCDETGFSGSRGSTPIICKRGKNKNQS